MRLHDTFFSKKNCSSLNLFPLYTKWKIIYIWWDFWGKGVRYGWKAFFISSEKYWFSGLVLYTSIDKSKVVLNFGMFKTHSPHTIAVHVKTLLLPLEFRLKGHFSLIFLNMTDVSCSRAYLMKWVGKLREKSWAWCEECYHNQTIHNIWKKLGRSDTKSFPENALSWMTFSEKNAKSRKARSNRI